MLVAPELLFNLWKVLFFSPQGLGQRPGAARGLQVLRFIGAVAALLLVRINVDAVQTSEEQQQRQDNNDCRIKIAESELNCATVRRDVLLEILMRIRYRLSAISLHPVSKLH